MGRPGLAEYYDKSGDMDENGVAEEKGLLDLSAGKNILLLQQGLRDYGFHDIASQLENLSGKREDAQIIAFQNFVLSGAYENAMELLPKICTDKYCCKKAKYEIFHKQFVEQIEIGDMEAAILTLRKKIEPLKLYPVFTEQLAGLFLIDLGTASSSRASEGKPSKLRPKLTRKQLLEKIANVLPPGLILPPGRFDKLIARAQQMQGVRQVGHNIPDREISVLREYEAGTEQLPTRLCNQMKIHEDEVWLVTFSHNGESLASASKDHSVALYDVFPNGDLHMVTQLTAHAHEVTQVLWRCDDTYILTCCRTEVKLWYVDMEAEHEEFVITEVAKITHPREQITAMAWSPKGDVFYTAATDKKIIEHDLKGKTLHRWQMKDRVNDLICAYDGQILICIVGDTWVELLRHEDHLPVVSIGGETNLAGISRQDPRTAITSITLTQDGEYLCMSLKNHICQLWRVGPILRRMMKRENTTGVITSSPYGLPTDEEGDEQIDRRPIMEYRSSESTDGRYVLRACFGGINEAFLACGSEGGKVYIWHRETGQLLARIDGHTAMVNCIAWNPKYPYMLASASDDKSIAMWVSPYSVGYKGHIPVETTLPQNKHLENIRVQVYAQRGALARTYRSENSEPPDNGLYDPIEPPRY